MALSSKLRKGQKVDGVRALKLSPELMSLAERFVVAFEKLAESRRLDAETYRAEITDGEKRSAGMMTTIQQMLPIMIQTFGGTISLKTKPADLKVMKSQSANAEESQPTNDGTEERQQQNKTEVQ